MKSLQGHFLVASPHLADPNFYRSVVLMVQHDEDGAFGLILNRPMQETVSDLWEVVCDQPCQCQAPVNHGGPVEGPLTAIHREPNCSEDEVLPGVYFAARREHLFQLVRAEPDRFRIFAGYAGWAGGQLEAELEGGGWLVTPATVDDVFADPDELWKTVMRRIGLQILGPSLKAKHIPSDPSAN